MDAIGRFVADAVLGIDTLWGGDVMCPSGTGGWRIHWFVCMRRLTMLRPGYRSGFLGGRGVADMKGNVGATRDIVHFALNELKQELAYGKDDEVRERLRKHLEEIKPRRTPDL